MSPEIDAVVKILQEEKVIIKCFVNSLFRSCATLLQSHVVNSSVSVCSMVLFNIVYATLRLHVPILSAVTYMHYYNVRILDYTKRCMIIYITSY